METENQNFSTTVGGETYFFVEYIFFPLKMILWLGLMAVAVLSWPVLH